jgi:branched-chain amino acid transport system substrate-binding protein
MVVMFRHKGVLVRKSFMAVAVVVLVATACGSSTKSSTSQGSSAGSASASSSQPVKIALLDFETGVYALPDRHNSVELAIDQLNAAGGINGHKVQYTAYDTGILPQTTLTAVEKAVSDHPTAIIGLAVSSGVQASASVLKSSGIPTIQQGQDNTTDLSRLGVTNMFRGQPSVTEQSQAAVNYISSLHPKTVGMFDDSDLNSVQAMKVIKAGLQAQGISNFVYREIGQTATDATEAALAMKGTDIVTSDGFPQEEAIFVKALAQNGIGVHDLMGNSGLIIAEFGLAPWSAVAGNSTYTVCDPATVKSTEADAFVKAYTAKYPSANVATSGANLYDAVMLVAKAIEQQHGSLAAGDVVKGLAAVSYKGACGAYHSDAEHTMAHSMYIVQFGSAQGQRTKVAEYDNMRSS